VHGHANKLAELLLPPLTVVALLSRPGSGVKVEENGRERARRRGQKEHFTTLISP
jgi:hypothetical protein